MRRISARFLTTLTALIAVLATTIGPAGAAPPTPIDVTFEESLAVTTGTLAAGSLPGCANPTTTTGPTTVTTSGPKTRFTGTKTITCADGSTLDLTFSAQVRGCDGTNSGRWRATGGTGVFEDARGGGRLNGTYPGGDSCTATSVLDRYTGRLRL